MPSNATRDDDDDIYIYIYIHTHTYIHTYMHTCMHTYIHTGCCRTIIIETSRYTLTKRLHYHHLFGLNTNVEFGKHHYQNSTDVSTEERPTDNERSTTNNAQHNNNSLRCPKLITCCCQPALGWSAACRPKDGPRCRRWSLLLSFSSSCIACSDPASTYTVRMWPNNPSKTPQMVLPRRPHMHSHMKRPVFRASARACCIEPEHLSPTLNPDRVTRAKLEIVMAQP